jgi:hypothetical protein
MAGIYIQKINSSLFILGSDTARQFSHLFKIVFREISFFEISQYFREFILHFHQEMFFKFLYFFTGTWRSNPWVPR